MRVLSGTIVFRFAVMFIFIFSSLFSWGVVYAEDTIDDLPGDETTEGEHKELSEEETDSSDAAEESEEVGDEEDETSPTGDETTSDDADSEEEDSTETGEDTASPDDTEENDTEEPGVEEVSTEDSEEEDENDEETTDETEGADETSSLDDTASEETVEEEPVVYPQTIEVSNATQLAYFGQQGLIGAELDEDGNPVNALFDHTFRFVTPDGVRADLTKGLRVRTASGGPFNLTDLGIYEADLDGLTAHPDKIQGSTKFGIPGQSLHFSEPVRLSIPTPDVTDGTILHVQVKHGGEEKFTIDSLTNNPEATCADGRASDQSNGALVADGYATIYTCGASDFVWLDSPGTGDAMLRTNLVEIGINQNGVFGADFSSLPTGFHDNRISGDFGFIANPADDGWVDYDGDFFTPGTREEGFCLEVAGTNYCNNKNSELTQIPGSNETVATGTFLSRQGVQLEWGGSAAGIDVHREYTIHQDQIYILMRTRLTNTTSNPLTGIYWMHNVDPDNNQTLGNGYATENTILSQPGSGNNYAQVLATQGPAGGATDLSGSNVSFFADDATARVTYGGFSNRNAFNIWTGTASFEQTVGATNTADDAISLAFQVGTLNAGQSVILNYAYNLADDASEIVAVIDEINSAVCGDGIVADSEVCDDGNTTNGDGCSSVCTVEDGYSCSGEPSVCEDLSAPSEPLSYGGGSSGSPSSSDAGSSEDDDTTQDTEEDDESETQAENEESDTDLPEEELTVDNLFDKLRHTDTTSCDDRAYIAERYQNLAVQEEEVVHVVPEEYRELIAPSDINRIQFIATLVRLLGSKQERQERIHDIVCKIEILKSSDNLRYENTGFTSGYELAYYLLQYIEDVLVLERE